MAAPRPDVTFCARQVAGSGMTWALVELHQQPEALHEALFAAACNAAAIDPQRFVRMGASSTV